MIKKLQILIVILGVLLTSCFKPEEVPILIFNGEANMTIAEFHNLHVLSEKNPPTKIEDDIIITGIVTSTDKYGSSYKEIFFQDETGGISLLTSRTDFTATFRVGQRIFVKAKDLYLGNYISGTRTGFYQLGLFGNTNGGIEHIPIEIENQHVFRSGTPETPPAPKIITTESDIVDIDYHTLVKLVNCKFTDAGGGTKYYDPAYSTTNRNITFNSGQGTIVARISQYCTFANDTLPEGSLNIQGMLTLYGTTSQLIICSINDVEILPEMKLLKEYNMATDPFSVENGWTNKQIQGDSKWKYFSGYVSIEAPKDQNTECWLVSPKLNFTGEKDIALFFNYRIRNGGEENVKLAYTVDGENWNLIEEFSPILGPSTESSVKLPAHVATNPNLQIAFQYKTSDKFPIWLITKIAFMANVMM